MLVVALLSCAFAPPSFVALHSTATCTRTRTIWLQHAPEPFGTTTLITNAIAGVAAASGLSAPIAALSNQPVAVVWAGTAAFAVALFSKMDGSGLNMPGSSKPEVEAPTSGETGMDDGVACYMVDGVQSDGKDMVVCTSQPKEFSWFYGIKQQQLVPMEDEGEAKASLQCEEQPSFNGTPEWFCK